MSYKTKESIEKNLIKKKLKKGKSYKVKVIYIN